MTLFLVWKIIVAFTASASWAGFDVKGVVRSLVRYISTVAAAQAALSPQLRRIVAALAQMSLIDGDLFFETAVRGLQCQFAYDGLEFSSK